MRITHDRSDRSVVSICDECPHRRMFSFTIDEARSRAVNHRITVHDEEPARAREAERKRHARRVAKELAQT